MSDFIAGATASNWTFVVFILSADVEEGDTPLKEWWLKFHQRNHNEPDVEFSIMLEMDKTPFEAVEHDPLPKELQDALMRSFEEGGTVRMSNASLASFADELNGYDSVY